MGAALARPTKPQAQRIPAAPVPLAVSDQTETPRLCYQMRACEPGSATMTTFTCIDDMRQTARRKVPRAFFEYADGGSYAEETLRANRTDLERIKLRQRILVDVGGRSTKTSNRRPNVMVS